jgi:hypothetical protein
MGKSKSQKAPILTIAYWDRPQPRDQGDAERAQIYQAIGAALNAWERLEETLALLCTVFSDTHDTKAHHAISEIFGSIESSSGRRKALERMALIYFHPHHEDSRLTKPLKDLLDAVSHASRRRDDIAHGVTTEFLHFQTGGISHGNRGSFLVPASYNSGRNAPKLHLFHKLATPQETTIGFDEFLRGAYRYTSEEIKTFEEKFRLLQMEVINYCGSITKVDGKISAIIGTKDEIDP